MTEQASARQRSRRVNTPTRRVLLLVGLLLGTFVAVNVLTLTRYTRPVWGPWLPSPVAIDSYGVEDRDAIYFSVGCPYGDPQVRRLAETKDAVRLEVVAVPSSRLCDRNFFIELAEPLGDRVVIDLSTGRQARELLP